MTADGGRLGKDLRLFRCQAQNPEDLPAVDTEHALRVATATLLVEVAAADFVLQDSEQASMRDLLRHEFDLSAEELDAVIEQAHQQADKLVSLQHITRLLNQSFDHAMKVRVIEMMWQLVFADGNKDHYEEYLIRQVAELLYISHSEFIRARHKAEPGD